jgi:thioredoxin reductase
LADGAPAAHLGDMNEANYDVIIVGGGAAGLSAALMLVRARRRVLVVDARAPRNAKAGHMHGYLSRDGMPPLELLERGRDEVLSYGGVVVTDYVEKAERGEDGFHVTLASGCDATGRQLLVATGLTDVLPDVPGVAERWAEDVHVCPYCHGWEVRDGALATLATGPFSTHHTLLLRQWSDDLVYFLNGHELDAADRRKLTARGVRIEERPVRKLVTAGEDGGLSGVELADGTVVPREALFLVPRLEPNSTLLDALGCEKDAETGWVTTGAGGRTSVPGVWVAGNVSDPTNGVIAAAGVASAIAAQINAVLVEADVEAAVGAAEATAVSG